MAAIPREPAHMTDEQFRHLDRRLAQLGDLLVLLVGGSETLNRRPHAERTIARLKEIAADVKPLPQPDR